MVKMTISAAEHDYLFEAKVMIMDEWQTKHNVAIFADEIEFHDNWKN